MEGYLPNAEVLSACLFKAGEDFAGTCIHIASKMSINKVCEHLTLQHDSTSRQLPLLLANLLIDNHTKGPL